MFLSWHKHREEACCLKIKVDQGHVCPGVQPQFINAGPPMAMAEDVSRCLCVGDTRGQRSWCSSKPVRSLFCHRQAGCRRMWADNRMQSRSHGFLWTNLASLGWHFDF